MTNTEVIMNLLEYNIGDNNDFFKLDLKNCYIDEDTNNFIILFYGRQKENNYSSNIIGIEKLEYITNNINELNIIPLEKKTNTIGISINIDFLFNRELSIIINGIILYLTKIKQFNINNLKNKKNILEKIYSIFELPKNFIDKLIYNNIPVKEAILITSYGELEELIKLLIINNFYYVNAKTLQDMKVLERHNYTSCNPIQYGDNGFKISNVSYYKDNGFNIISLKNFTDKLNNSSALFTIE